MDKVANFQYFLKALKAGNVGRLHWVTSAFSAMEHAVYDPGRHVLPKEDDLQLIKDYAQTYPYRLFRFSESSIEIGYLDPETEELVSLGDKPKMEPLFNFQDLVTIDESVLENVTGTIETRYGNVLVNWLCLVKPFGKKIGFVTGEFDGGDLDKLVMAKYARTPPPAKFEDRLPDLIYVDEYLIYQKHLASMDTWATFAAAAVTLKGLTANPEVSKFIAEKLKEHGGKPTITELALIEEAAAKLDKDSFKGTPDAKFLSKKNIAVNRKKMNYIYGLEEGMGNPTIINTPLSEGVKAEGLPAYADAMRAASYNRGKLTALGGVGVKRANQVFSAIRLAEKDCKDKDGFLITVLNKKELEDTYTWHNGQWVILNADQIAKYVGKQARIRSPYTCKTAAPHFCETCVGLTIAKFPNGIHNFVAAISSREMLLFMKAMHGRSLATTPLNPSISFS